jgi:ergothioneine biosynthesis protein EgtB
MPTALTTAPQYDSASPALSAADAATFFRSVRSLFIDLAAYLTPEDQMVQSCAEASPTKWHLAHTTWFYETFILREHLPNYRPFNDDFVWLFNSYYQSLGEFPAKSLRSSFSRPSHQQILDYRSHVDAAILAHLNSGHASDDFRSLVELGCHHEQQHQELALYDIKHAFFTNPLHPALRPMPTASQPAASPLRFHSLAPGLVPIGHDPRHGFSFDNETPSHLYYVAPFSLASRLVTCAEYLDFIRDRGYATPNLWLSDGWDTVQSQQWSAPLYWRARGSDYEIFTLHGFQPPESLASTPVCHLSYYEADAFARWAGARLPSEFEWESACATPELGSTTAAISLDQNRLHSGFLHPESTHSPTLLGNLWQWTQSAYTSYPGYHPTPGALGEYNGKFMVSQQVLRGSSVVTPASHIRSTYRNFFHPQMRWQFSGIRLAQDAVLTPSGL